jgi:hypothetical protein
MNQNIIDKYINDINKGSIGSIYELATYYKIHIDYSNMVKYYLLATKMDINEAGNKDKIHNFMYPDVLKYYIAEIENNNNIYAMNILGLYYSKLHDIDNMKKYYIMAINNGYSVSMHNLAFHYNKSDFKQMIKYGIMAIEHGCHLCPIMIADYYDNINDIENMIKYYKIGVERGCKKSMAKLCYYYYVQNDHINIIKYCMISIYNGCAKAAHTLINYYNNIKPESYMAYIIEIYNICCEINKYTDGELEYIRSRTTFTMHKISVYLRETYLGKYLLINKYINCSDISKIICNY